MRLERSSGSQQRESIDVESDGSSGGTGDAAISAERRSARVERDM